MVRLGSVAKTQMPISLHSDMPMAPADPLFLAWCAVTRQTVSGRVAAPNQRIAVDRALSAITIESAYVLNQENELGSIKPGKKADFTILEQDPYKVPVAQLKDVPVWGVVFAGKKYPATGAATSPVEPSGTEFAPDAIDLEQMSTTRG
jgi:predicted amidohydrolase YtcJ